MYVLYALSPLYFTVAPPSSNQTGGVNSYTCNVMKRHLLLLAVALCYSYVNAD